MPRVKTVIPGIRPSRVKGQRSLDSPFLHRFFAPWQQPRWESTEFWRWTVQNIPVAIDCREALISYISALKWKIEPKDSDKRDELSEEIEYHTELLEQGGRPDLVGWDFVSLIESILQDYLDTPFGCGVETIREGDKPDGRVLYILYMDAGSLFPTLREKYPVAQQIKEASFKQVVFPKHAVNRMYMSPRPQLKYEGWGMAPPEKIFLAMEQVRRGDIYLAKFLVDTPEAGLLDLIDMSQDAASDWIEAFKDLYTGIDPFKIPVLYEHDQPAKWIPFGRPPSEIQFQDTYYQYVTLITTCYGITPTDIGFPSKGGGGGETLAGSIRDERRTRRSGVARTKEKLRHFINRMLPDSVHFLWIDIDDEVSVAQSRARLANATAANQYISDRVFSPKEMRMQAIADGLVTIAVPEEVPEDEFPPELDPNINERPGMLGKPVKPSMGGHGEISTNAAFSTIVEKYLDIETVRLRKLARAVLPKVTIEANKVFEDLDVSDYDWWISWHDDALWGNLGDQIPELTLSTINDGTKAIEDIIKSEEWFKLETSDVTRFVLSYLPTFREIREDFYVAKSQADYEFGKADSYVEGVDPDPEIEKVFKHRLRELFRNFWDTVSTKFSKAIVAGARNSIIEIGKLHILDNLSSIDDNSYVLPCIRKELAKLNVSMTVEIEKRISEMINLLLEEQINDGNKESSSKETVH